METNHHTKRYIDYHEKYVEKYGENTVVLMQTGSHFNIFAIINDEISIGPDIYHICQNVLNNALLVTKQNKKNPEISYSNCLLAGFPLSVIQKYENILLSNNYTVVVVEQITPPPNPERGVTRVISPGTSIDSYNKQDSHYLMSIYIEKNENMTKVVYITGISVIDLSTGKNYLHYIISKIDDNQLWIDEIGRYIHFYNPSELLFHFKNFLLTENEIIQKWDIYHNSIQINHYKDKNYLKVNFQNEFLQKIFNLNVMMTPIEHFDLEMKPELVVSYIYLLQYIKDHIAETLQNIELPELLNDDHCLCLTSNSIRQLNVINNYSYFKGKNESLLSVCNACVTPMGRRLFKERLLYPSLNPKIITQRYDFIELFRKDKFYEKIQSTLRKVSDLEKSLRKMGLNLLPPSEFFSDTLSFEYILKVLDILEEERYVIQKAGSDIDELIHTFRSFYESCKNTFIFHNLSQTTNLEKSILQKDINIDLDRYGDLTDEYYQILTLVSNRLSKLLDGSENSIKLDYDDRNEWFFYCTNKRASTFKERLNNLTGGSIHVKDQQGTILVSLKKSDFSYKKKDGSSTIIHFDYCKEISKKLITSQDYIKKLNKEEWDKQIKRIYDAFNLPLKKFYFFLSEVDCYCSGAKISIQNGYYRPLIKDAEKSFLDCEEIRHPIVEKIHTETPYITNDIHLGKQGEKDGILLFGTNACGKSTFMKAIGLNIIMAQAGLFVAAKKFIYKPYSQIFTRILNNDNIFRSQSSFAVEIQELKSILNRANKDSLVLGDELCSGTESISGLSIIASGLNLLCKHRTSFVFTSHLHQLTTLDEVQRLKNLKIYHLKIEYDKGKDILIYDRKLGEGSGPSIYGLKVCEAMGLSNEFISFAKNIQNKLEKDPIHNTKLSQYNSKVYMDECKICHKKDSLETHHIQDQQYADKNDMIKYHHKNIKHNLVPLCKACHLKVTNKEIIIEGWKETSRGKVLKWYKSEKSSPSRRKFNDDQIKEIKRLKEEYNHLSHQDFLKKIDLEHGLKVSMFILKKIVEGVY